MYFEDDSDVQIGFAEGPLKEFKSKEIECIEQKANDNENDKDEDMQAPLPPEHEIMDVLKTLETWANHPIADGLLRQL